jgi:O-methyltransferase
MQLLKKAARVLGYDLVRRNSSGGAAKVLTDLAPRDKTILKRVAPYTMTSVERQIALVQAARHVVRGGVPGCFVECGVWRGGSSMLAALTFAGEGDAERDLYLYDTFEGMTPPTDDDRTADGTLAQTHLANTARGTGVWCCADLDDVKANLATTGYPPDRLHYIQGPVEETIPAQLPPAPIALLRLDTDWYESTRHELEHLFPLVADGGAIIIDDYGHWEGARKAVDEYLAALPRRYFLHRIDYTGRLLIK